jgi:DNA-binding NarL/FixJ family response regulator
MLWAILRQGPDAKGFMWTRYNQTLHKNLHRKCILHPSPRPSLRLVSSLAQGASRGSAAHRKPFGFSAIESEQTKLFPGNARRIGFLPVENREDHLIARGGQNSILCREMPIRVLLVDDHALIRQGIKVLLEKQGFQVVCEASDGQEALRFVQHTQPEIAIVDISMPILNGVDTARELKKTAPKTKVILLTQHDEDQYVTESLRAGVRGYVLKSQAGSDLVHAIQEVCRGSVYLSPKISRAVVDAYLSKALVAADPLSGRERQVLQLVGEGNTTKDIAVHMGISVKTAESHRAHLMKKLDIHETASLVRYAIRNGLIQP